MRLDLHVPWRERLEYAGWSALTTAIHVVAWLIILLIVAMMSVSRAY